MPAAWRAFAFRYTALRFTDYYFRASPSPEMFMRLLTLTRLLLSLSLLVALPQRQQHHRSTASGSDSGSGGTVNDPGRPERRRCRPARRSRCAASSSPRSTTSARRSATSGSRSQRAASSRASTCSRRAHATSRRCTVGDIVNLTGAIKSEFALTGSNADPSGRTVTELEPASGGTIMITKTGTTATIPPGQGRRARDRPDVRLDDVGHGGGTAFTQRVGRVGRRSDRG